MSGAFARQAGTAQGSLGGWPTWARPCHSCGRGSIEVGKSADLVIVPENPLANFKVLYGTGAQRLINNHASVYDIY
jgi:hypothetical protein